MYYTELSLRVMSAELCGSHICSCFRFILSVRVLRRNVPRDRGAENQIRKTRVQEKRSRRDDRDVMKKTGQCDIAFRLVRIAWRKHVLCKSF